MRPLPTVGGDTGTWGTVLNAYLAELGPAGAMMEYAGAAAPSGWLLCDGNSYLRADYNDLFTALGGGSSPWGLPDGTHFNVPDMRGRMPVGKGTHADVDTLAETDGSASGSRTPKHKHTASDTGHGHTASDSGHGHTASDSGHGHTATDSGHSHSATDSGHTHPGTFLTPTGPFTREAGSNPLDSGSVGTGYANITVATGNAVISVASGNANVIVGPQSNSPTDGPAYAVVNYIIKT